MGNTLDKMSHCEAVLTGRLSIGGGKSEDRPGIERVKFRGIEFRFSDHEEKG